MAYRKNYLIASANNYGNIGDDICGYSAKYLVKTIDPTARTIVTSPPYKKGLVDKSDVIIIGGGGVIYDTDMANVDNYMGYVEEAKHQGKTTAVLGVGVQGITTKEGKERYKATLTATDVVTVRSPVDERLLRDIGVANAVVTQDLGFLTDEWIEPPSMVDKIRLRRVFRRNIKPNLALAIVDLVAIKGNAYDDKSANFVDSLNDNLDKICKDFNVYLLVHSADDAKYYEQLQSRFDVRKIDYKTIRDLPYFWAAYNKMDLIIASRFHAIILGCLAKKPVISVSSESTKQNRLANYDMPTIKRQRILFSEMSGVRDLFKNLKRNYDEGKYSAATDDELLLAKERARLNCELLQAAVETA